MVERTAHNGLVVGSNPTEPKKMRLTARNHKLQKTKKYFQKT